MTIERLRWQILDQRCDSRALRNVGSKTLVVFCFFSFFVEISGPTAKTVLAARSLEFNVSSKIVTNRRERRMLE